MKKIIKKKKTITICSLILGFIIFLIVAISNKLRVVVYSINSHKLTDSICIAFLSDLHSSGYGKNQDLLIKETETQNPDIVLLGGDIFDDELDDDNAITYLSAIAAKYPCYYVSGNHEYWTGNIDELKELMKGMNITILEGDCKQIKVGTQTINICGVDDPTYIGEHATKAQIEKAYNECNTDYFTILLSHRPELVDIYKKYGFDLILTGHAHGGQWRIPGIFNGLYAPDQGLFPNYAGGEYQIGNSTMIVSRGLSKKHPLIPRIFNRPELVIIDLH